jgi:quercetin dioxygenase-like cupin family protein
MKIPHSIAPELYDVFEVRQVTRSTTLESIVAVDLVTVAPQQESESHRHNKADTVLLMLKGAGTVRVAGVDYAVTAGDRIHIPPGAFHQVITGAQALEFVSVQTPPILSKEDGTLDLETEGV